MKKLIKTWGEVLTKDEAEREIASRASRGSVFSAVSRFFINEKGEVQIGGVMLMAILIVFIAIGFTFLPTSTNAVTDLLAYEYSTNTAITDATFTGYTAVLGITPLLIVVGFLVSAVVTGMLGLKMFKGAAGAYANPATIMLLSLSLIFIAIALYIQPVMLDGVASVVHGDGEGISTALTGYSPVILMSPMLVHIGFLTFSVFTGFFGMKRITASAGDS